jgi:uncharacterized protein
VTDDTVLSQPFWLRLVAVGLIGGFFAGVFGVGGGLLMVPLLLWWTTMNQRQANATSLLAITPAAIMGALSYGIGGVFAWLPAIFVAAGSVTGAQLGAWILKRIPLVPLRWSFIAFVALSGALLFVTVPNRDALFELTAATGALLIVLGLLMGIAAGLFGIGGGVIVIPALMVFLGQSDLVAKSVSLLAMAPGSLSGSISHLRYQTASLRDGAWVSIGAVITTPIGALIAFVLSAQAAAVLFGALTVFIASSLIYQALTERKRS